MPRKVYDLAVKTGEYTNGAGETKARWLTVGQVMQDDHGGQFVLLRRSFNPAGVDVPQGRDSVVLSMFAPKDGKEAGGDTPSASYGNAGGRNAGWGAPSGDEPKIPF